MNLLSLLFFVFLAVAFAVYYLVPKKAQWIVLLIASLIFYGWGEPRYLAIMLFTIIINYIGAIYIEKNIEL